MVVGQNPGTVEDDKGKPFLGKSGQLLRLLCDAAGISPADVYRTNAVRCLSPGNRKPKKDEIESCRQYLIEEIKAVKPKVIVTMGEVPLISLYGMGDGLDHYWEMAFWEDTHKTAMAYYEEALATWTVGDKKTRGLKPKKPKPGPKPKKPKTTHTAIKDVSGHTLIQPDTGIPLIPSYHPAFLMRGNYSHAELVISHLEKARRIADGTQKVGTLGSYYTVQSLDELRALRDLLLDPESDTVWFDCETTGTDWKTDELLCISFTTAAGEGYVVPILSNGGRTDGELDFYPPWVGHLDEVVEVLREIFGSEKDKGGQNVIFDLRFISRKADPEVVTAATAFDIPVRGRKKDTELVANAIAEDLPKNMTALLARWTDMPFYEADVKGKKGQMAKIPDDDTWAYSAADADGLPRLWEPLRKRAEAEGVTWVLDNITMPMLEVCRDMETRGFPINEEYFYRLNDFYLAQIAKAEAELWAAVPDRAPGWKYNYAPTLREVLFHELKLPASTRKTESGKGCPDCRHGVCFAHRQTGKDALKDIARLRPHPALNAIIKLKNLTKRQSVYLCGSDGMKGWARFICQDGRIHASFKISRVATGRLASENPNIQNGPNYVHIHPKGAACKDKDCTQFFEETFGIDTTNAFHDVVEAPPGKGIMNADWSQLEVWVLAYRVLRDTGDRTLLDVLISGVDIHLWMARRMWPEIGEGMQDKEWKETYGVQRRRAKTLVFGLGYGLTVEGFMLKEPDCTEEEAIDAIEKFFAVMPGLKLYHAGIKRQLFEVGFVTDEFGRRRHMNYFNILKAMGERNEIDAKVRVAINMPIQSGGSNLHSIASAATARLKALVSRGCYPILSIHDSLVFEFDWPSNDYAKETAWIIRNLWQDVARATIKPDGEPLRWDIPVEIEWGKKWGTPTFKLDRNGNLTTPDDVVEKPNREGEFDEDDEELPQPEFNPEDHETTRNKFGGGAPAVVAKK